MDPNIQAQVNSLLQDPAQIKQRDAEIYKVFEQAKLTEEEAVLVMDKINNHRELEKALLKLKPFVVGNI